jgi:hypothetical protein
MNCEYEGTVVEAFLEKANQRGDIFLHVIGLVLCRQGDQIGRIFAYCVIVYFGRFSN